MTGTSTGKVAVTGADGSPHVTPVWFVLDGDEVMFTTHETSARGRALRRDRRICLCVDDQEPPYSFVIIWGEAVISEGLADLRHWAGVIGGRYMGAGQAAEYGARNGMPGELLVRIRPRAVIAERDIAH